MEHTEIERKFLPSVLSDGPEHYPHKEFLQDCLSASPTVRVHRGGKAYMLAYKGSGLLKWEEYNLPFVAENFARLPEKYDSLRIRKIRYSIPFPGTVYTTGLDRFQGELAGLLLVEVEFPDKASARAFTPPAWFGGEMVDSPHYQSPSLSRFGPPGEGRV